MKVRKGFVSNSSSSSFVIKLEDIDFDQLDKIINHKKYADECDDDDSWSVVVHDKKGLVECSTDMDNFDMIRWLADELKIPENKIVTDSWLVVAKDDCPKMFCFTIKKGSCSYWVDSKCSVPKSVKYIFDLREK